MTKDLNDSSSKMVEPHGGVLKDMIVGSSRRDDLTEQALYLNSWDLTQRQTCDIEILLNGGFSPLDGFMGEEDYKSVCKEMRLTNGILWPLPITLDVTEDMAKSIVIGGEIALRHPEGMVLAVMKVTDLWRPDFNEEAELVYGTGDEVHPGVFALHHQTNPVYLGGSLEGLELPPQHTFKHLRHTPKDLRALFEKKGWDRVVAFQTRNPMHRAHVELTRRAAEETGANLLINPVVGQTKPGDIDYFVRVRCYEAVYKHFPQESTALSLLPLAMRMAGPREAVWHAIIRKNYGCSDFIVGRDHAGPGSDASGKPFYSPYAAQDLLSEYQEELNVKMASFEEMVYVKDSGSYVPRSKAPQDSEILSVSGTELRGFLNTGSEVPEWFSYPEVISELRRSYPPRADQGFVVFFTGLPSSGKSTIANILQARLMELDPRPVTLLDGDLVRKHLSSELGFSKEHRDLNIQRIGYVASEIAKNRGMAICAPIAPYAAIRRGVREMISAFGGFIEVYVATPVEVCEKRDRKGLYAKARAGILKGFTGVDDPYEQPENPEVKLDTTAITAEEGAEKVISHLRELGFLQ